ncbi:hypothetical protein Ahy_A04g018653 [Arachis hypogaea]|uniref:Uncharacterized protein n=1 Tax=Arachis hypogaea TaxID=3818 RepID=A0A445DEC2_ARAHY|nr:hypothetical protein Ahy_A04g018653 [Arachis hypogaea]
MAVVAFNWVALFWFFWYIIDWMESEMYSGEHGKLYSVAIPLYTIGYRYGARCIMLTWVVTGLMSLAVEPIGKLAKDERLKRNNLTFTREPSNGIQAWVLRFFSVLGISLMYHPSTQTRVVQEKMAVALSCVQDKLALPEEESRYRYGVRCIMLTWVVTGLMSLAVEPIGKLAKDARLNRNDLTFSREPSNGIQAWILHFFGILGISIMNKTLHKHKIVATAFNPPNFSLRNTTPPKTFINNSAIMEILPSTTTSSDHSRRYTFGFFSARIQCENDIAQRHCFEIRKDYLLFHDGDGENEIETKLRRKKKR